MMTSKDVWKLETTKVIVQFDGDSGQPIGDSGGLLGSWLGQLSNDVNLLLINYSDWRVVPNYTKNGMGCNSDARMSKNVFWDEHKRDGQSETLQNLPKGIPIYQWSHFVEMRFTEMWKSKFWFDDPMMRKEYVMSALGSRCKDVKKRLWDEHKRDGQSETLQNLPKGIPIYQWSHFVEMRFTEKWKKIKTGKTPSRAEFFIETRRKPDGSFVCEEAQTHAEALRELLSKNPQVTSNVPTSLDDEYAQVFGPEHPGRVRCIGRGPNPSKLLRRSVVPVAEIENFEMVVELKAEVKDLRDQVKAMNTFIQQILGTSTGEQATAWASSFAAAFANIQNPGFANIPAVPNLLGMDESESAD
ncbi:unnamed protein product [Thlaspi arvense]|uniref:Transposase n=1 Tax=Thlaspi arvense TaxID=13288 RepID=A0AAU9RCY2_THLAR|nr:unnamed protein product [Thlaspi arvense]